MRLNELDGIVDFIHLQMGNKIQEVETITTLLGYRGSVAMYNNLNKAQRSFLESIKEKKSVDVVWEEAAKLALWLARIADLYEKEFDREEEVKIAS